MAVKKNTTKATTVATTVENESAVVSNDNVVENKNTILSDTDEIEVISLVPNVSYKDSHTGDFYEWETVNHSEYMTFETLKNLWRNHRGYFRNLYLKPLDERVVNKFGLKSTYEKYDFLMDESNYTLNNVQKIRETYNSMPNDLKYSLCNKIKNLVATEKIVDYRVIRKLEDFLNIVLE